MTVEYSRQGNNNERMDRREFLVAAVAGVVYLFSRGDGESGNGESAPVPAPSDLLNIESGETETIVSSTIENYGGVAWDDTGALELESGGALEIDQL